MVMFVLYSSLEHLQQQLLDEIVFLQKLSKFLNKTFYLDENRNAYPTLDVRLPIVHKSAK